MIKNLFNINGTKVLNKVAQKDIKGGQPEADRCIAGDGTCPPGFCCNGGACIDDTPVNNVPPCDPPLPY